jgi:hypothetical protein
MARELPRTLATLEQGRQHGVEASDYEVIVVDNGSHESVDQLVADFRGDLRVVRIDPAPPSPAGAANRGLSLARAELIGLVIDGARLASPGLLAGALRAATLAPRAVITAPAFHLGPATHMHATDIGYDQQAEDELMATVPWEDDGYELFRISTPAGSSSRGLFGPMGESSSIFLSRRVWDDLGGLDTSFRLPGGGLVNHDLYRRACELPGTELVVLLGEGTFHQYHGGVATSRRLRWEPMHEEYLAIRGHPFRPPDARATFVGSVHPALYEYLEHSAQLAIRRRQRRDHRSAGRVEGLPQAEPEV